MRPQGSKICYFKYCYLKRFLFLPDVDEEDDDDDVAPGDDDEDDGEEDEDEENEEEEEDLSGEVKPDLVGFFID